MQEQQLHINVLEMKAVKLALLAYHKHFQMKAIHFQIDNTTILSYVVKMGRTKNKYLMELSKEIWKYLLHHGITITAEYLPSSTDMEADWQSINSKDHSEWKFFHKYFREFVRSKENQRWIFLLLDCQHNFHGTMHRNQIHTVRERVQCSKSGLISTFMLSHLFQ